MQGCKKGDAGPQGPAGPQGIQGVKGDNGSMIYSGNDVPAASQGVNGDYYFRLSNSMFYSPKTAAGWGSEVNLRGATGSANVIYSGWLSFPQSQRDTSIDGTQYKVNHINVPRLTQSLVDQGLIMVYYLLIIIFSTEGIQLLKILQ